MVISLVSASECRHIGGGKIDWHTKFGASVTYKKVVVFCIKLYEAIKFRMCQKSAFFEMFCLPKTCHGGCVGRIVLCTILA